MLHHIIEDAATWKERMEGVTPLPNQALGSVDDNGVLYLHYIEELTEAEATKRLEKAKYMSTEKGAVLKALPVDATFAVAQPQGWKLPEKEKEVVKEEPVVPKGK